MPLLKVIAIFLLCIAVAQTSDIQLPLERFHAFYVSLYEDDHPEPQATIGFKEPQRVDRPEAVVLEVHLVKHLFAKEVKDQQVVKETKNGVQLLLNRRPSSLQQGNTSIDITEKAHVRYQVKVDAISAREIVAEAVIKKFITKSSYDEFVLNSKSSEWSAAVLKGITASPLHFRTASVSWGRPEAPKEEELLQFINATKLESWQTTDFKEDAPGPKLSDAFFRNDAVRAMKLFNFGNNAESNIDDFGLWGLSAEDVNLGKAPRITPLGVRGFVQPLLDFKTYKRTLRASVSFSRVDLLLTLGTFKQQSALFDNTLWAMPTMDPEVVVAVRIGERDGRLASVFFRRDFANENVKPTSKCETTKFEEDELSNIAFTRGIDIAFYEEADVAVGHLKLVRPDSALLHVNVHRYENVPDLDKPNLFIELKAGNGPSVSLRKVACSNKFFEKPVVEYNIIGTQKETRTELLKAAVEALVKNSHFANVFLASNDTNWNEAALAALSSGIQSHIFQTDFNFKESSMVNFLEHSRIDELWLSNSCENGTASFSNGFWREPTLQRLQKVKLSDKCLTQVPEVVKSALEAKLDG